MQFFCKKNPQTARFLYKMRSFTDKVVSFIRPNETVRNKSITNHPDNSGEVTIHKFRERPDLIENRELFTACYPRPDSSFVISCVRNPSFDNPSTTSDDTSFVCNV